MTGFWGADTEVLRQTAGALGGGSERIDDLAARLGAVIDAVHWVGPDAESFRADWSGQVRPGLLARVSRLRQQERELDAHAWEQDETSSAGTAGGGGVGREGPAGRGGGRDAAPPVISPPPPISRTDLLRGAGASAAVGTMATLAAADLRLMAGGVPPTMHAKTAGAAVNALDVSAAVGESGLAFPDSGMELIPPETASTVTVDGDHELAPVADDEPFGLDADGAPLDLSPDTTYDVGDHGTYYTDGEGRITYIEATGGGKEMNPNLREVFPDATYHVNDSTFYRTDELGRTEHMYVPDVIVDREMSRSQSIQSKIAERWDMAGDGTSEPVEFNAGHMLARQLGGIREEINYTRQWDEVNQARSGAETIYSFESLMADGIADDGSSYSYETRVTWGEEQPEGVSPEQGSEPWEYVPSGYDVRIHENGEQIVEEHLPNYPDGARFPG